MNGTNSTTTITAAHEFPRTEAERSANTAAAFLALGQHMADHPHLTTPMSVDFTIFGPAGIKVRLLNEGHIAWLDTLHIDRETDQVVESPAHIRTTFHTRLPGTGIRVLFVVLRPVSLQLVRGDG